MKALLEEMKEITILDPMITIRFAIKPETETQLEELADTLLQTLELAGRPKHIKLACLTTCFGRLFLRSLAKSGVADDAEV